MIQLILFLALGAAFLILLLLFARKASSGSRRDAEALIEARQALTSLQSGLLPQELVDRVFARADLDFVRGSCPRTIRRAFLRERRRIALSWIVRVRKQVLNLKRFYSGESRRYAQLDMRTELGLAVDFASLLMACRILQVVFYVRGPYAAPRIVGTVIGVAGNVCSTSQRSLAFLKPAAANAYGDRSAGGRAVV